MINHESGFNFMIPPEEYYKNLPRKYLGAGLLFLNSEGEVLLVKPTYKEGWEVPGGIVEKNESPQEACIREVKEELGLDTIPGVLLSFDYTKQYGFKGDTVQFIFFGGVLTAETISKIKLQPEELAEFGFYKIDSLPKLTSRMAIKLPKAYEAYKTGKTIYYEIPTDLS